MPTANSPNGSRVTAPPASEAALSLSTPGQSDLFDLQDFSAELRRLSAVNRELLGHQESAPAPAAADVKLPDEVVLLRMENAELRTRVEELEHLLQHAGGAEDIWAERQREYESLLEEKSEVIRTLHLRLRELQDQEPRTLAAGPIAHAPDLVALKQELEEQRRQLEEDEEAMMGQLRQMEMALSKDRADLARQRQELQRLHTELNHELETAARDPELRERLKTLRRPPDPSKVKLTTPVDPTPAEPKAPPGPNKNSGLFKRIFG